MKKKRVVVAMSGGVDSSVAAVLLQKQGYEVIGMTMCFNLPDLDRKRPACCSAQAIDDARRVAHKLGIKHYVLNMQRELKEQVIKDFCREYSSGRTPNPCVRCNQFIKFGSLLQKALGIGADYLATGHYARIVINNEFLLRKAKDKYKDQSYFLYRLNQRQLKHVIFPLGNYTKSEVRGLAREFGLAVAEKAASQEICFLPDEDYRGFLKKYLGPEIIPGNIVDIQGKVLGKHKGIAFYTIGQREGLGIAMGYPVYIIRIKSKTNQIVVGSKKEAFAGEFLVKDTHFSFLPIKKKVALRVKIRYNHKESLADIFPFKRKLRVVFRKPQFAITPGQSAVFYERDRVTGGGIIDKVL
ncbi:MAG: tRNA 2-thiouridine(34) synthase MnmA [Candidatus Omnitrophica bacterium]|nr:tRNA 2-thiouridine(34) synthase MnmA [Candidatus Omnitrophota bacterium]MBU1870332.1 tRNA 2-thiouridine(34) synthase MnmA [Candidatus Omnitrophota bacterium]